MAYHRCRSQRESLLSAVVMLGMILVPYFMLIQPMSQSMLDVKVPRARFHTCFQGKKNNTIPNFSSKNDDF